MDKPLIAIVNCRKRQDWANAVRSTWAPLVPRDKADLFFFVGRGETWDKPEDTIELDCDDSYHGLPEKVRAIARWANEQNYPRFLKCDDDVIMNVDGLFASGFEKFHYVGRANRPPTVQNPFVVPMGFCYWLDRPAMRLLVDEPLLDDGTNDDERWVARTMHKGGIELQDDPRYRLHIGRLCDAEHIMRRPLRPNIRRTLPPGLMSIPGAFAWCIFMEGNSGSSIPTSIKIEEFHKVFQKYCPASVVRGDKDPKV